MQGGERLEDIGKRQETREKTKGHIERRAIQEKTKGHYRKTKSETDQIGAKMPGPLCRKSKKHGFF